MSRQLSRLRSLVSEIDEIQRKGRESRPAPLAVPPLSMMEPEMVTPSVFSGVSAPVPPPAPVQEAQPQPAGRVAVTLTPNVILEINAGEIVEIRKSADGLEILFQDGKAFHIPFKAVA